MILIIPTHKVDLTGLPCWFVRAYAIVYGIAFVMMLASFAYAISQLL